MEYSRVEMCLDGRAGHGRPEVCRKVRERIEYVGVVK